MQENVAQTYQLVILVKKPVALGIGSLGKFKFPTGVYLYTGSGKRNIEARVARHYSRSKKTRWHIDYLLSNSVAEVIGTLLFSEGECTVNKNSPGH